MRKKKALFYLTFAALLLPSAVKGESVKEYLERFHENPKRMMERLPSVVDNTGKAHPRGYIQFEKLKASFAYRLKTRAKLVGLSVAELTTSTPRRDGKDDAEKILEKDTKITRSIPDMEALSLQNISVSSKPWSDSYWPTYRGQIAYRYADDGVPKDKNWISHYYYAQNNPAAAIVATGDSNRINLLSPAEKYDFVMGDFDYTLTRYAWAEGQRSLRDGGLATWMGICHGWSAAAHMGTPFIAQPVTVLAQSGIPVTFYPQDIKALQSMLWANGSPTARFVSGRCGVYRPARDAFGRVLDPNCFDTSPATWHLAVVNQLGKNDRSFVFDATYDAEVWNFPIQRARYRYFNPQTFEESPAWQRAAIPLESFTLDKFKKFRSPSAKYVLGIYMDITYPLEIEPGINRVFDAPTKTVRYIYDLELDSSFQVIGGEWYSNAHPDFIWTFDKTAQAMAYDEQVLLSDPWANKGPLPLAWTPYARRASSHGVPLYAFLKTVVNFSGPVKQP